MSALDDLSPAHEEELVSTAESSELFHNWLNSNNQTRFIHLRWLDLSGVLRTRIVTREHCVELVKSNQFLRCAPNTLDVLLNSTYTPGLTLRGSHILQPDWTSVRRLTGWPSRSLHAAVMCSIVSSVPGRPLDYDICPRRALEKVLEKASTSFGLSFLVGFEVEFVVMKMSSDGECSLESAGIGYSSASGLRDPTFQYVEECVVALQEAGVQIQGFHCEGSHRGQFEIAIGPMPPMKAVDQLTLAHDSIKNIFATHGYVATMSPKPVASSDELANGQHTHVSLAPTINEEELLAGILKRLPLICAFCLPHDISYRRLSPFQGGRHVSWGTEDRSGTIRKIKRGHWEIRCIDATANMYLGLAVILSAGLLGIQHRESLSWKDSSECDEPDKNLPEEEPMPQDMPRSIEETLGYLEVHLHDIEAFMGGKIIRHYLTLNKVESERLRSMDMEEIHRLLLEVF